MANLKKSKTSVNVGVNVGKFYLNVHIYEKSTYFREENTPKGIQKILERIAMEATRREEQHSTWQR